MSSWSRKVRSPWIPVSTAIWNYLKNFALLFTRGIQFDSTPISPADKSLKSLFTSSIFPFDGETVIAEASFVADAPVLLGTGMLRLHRLDVNFVARTVLLERAS